MSPTVEPENPDTVFWGTSVSDMQENISVNDN